MKFQIFFGVLCFLALVSSASAREAAQASRVTTMSLADCYRLLDANNAEAKMSKLRLSLEEYGLRKHKNDFNTGFSADYNTSSFEFGGATVDSAIYGTRQDNESVSFKLEQPLKLGGNVGIKYDQNKAETNSAFGNPETFSSALSLTWQQPLFRKAGSITSLYEYNRQHIKLEQQRLATEDDIILLRYDMLAEILDCLRKQETIRIREMSLATNKLLLATSEAKRKAGLASKLDVLESRLQLAEADTNLTKAKGELDRAYNKLGRRLGIDGGRDLHVNFPLEHRTGLPQEDESIKKAFLHRRDVARQRLEIRLRELDLSYYKNEDKPDISLTTTLQRSGEGITRSTGNELDNQSYMVGLKYTTRFGLRDEAIVRSSFEKQLSMARLELEKQEADVKLEVKNYLQELADAEAVVKLAKQQRELAEEKFKFTRKAYANQLRTMVHVLEAEEDMTLKRAEYLTSLVNHLTARLNLLKSMGSPLSLKDVRAGEKS